MNKTSLSSKIIYNFEKNKTVVVVVVVDKNKQLSFSKKNLTKRI